MEQWSLVISAATNVLKERRGHFKSDFRLRSRDNVERVAMSLRRRSAN
jgi:hypothetical protein